MKTLSGIQCNLDKTSLRSKLDEFWMENNEGTIQKWKSGTEHDNCKNICK